ncbi:MAG: methyl-accepting chemotaxis protein [Desulfobulbus sp.]
MPFSVLHNLSLKKKLVGGFLLTSMITLIIGGKSLITLSTNTDNLHRLQNVELSLLVTSEQLEILALNHRRFEKDVFLNIGKPDKQRSYLSKFGDITSKTIAALDRSNELIANGVNIPASVKQALRKSRDAYGHYVSGFQQIAEAVIADPSLTPQAANKRMIPIKDHIYQFEEGITLLAQEAENLITHITQEMLASSNRTRFVIALFVLAGVACSVALGIIISLAISRPMLQATKFAEQLARGDFSVSLPSYSNDEIGKCIQALNRMSEQLKITLRNVVGGVITLNDASADLFAIAKTMTVEANTTSGNTDSVAEATEAMTTNIQAVAAAMEESSTNVSMVAAATEEMSTTIDEIASSATLAQSISDAAVKQAMDASDLMSTLGRAANKINHVTETITEISEQTNLLALNATIEAARAGEAGKGFAVVANEIKELAKQTATATLDIKSQVSDVQTTTAKAVTQIINVAQVITNINDIISSMAGAVSEQSIAIREITTNVSQASAGIQVVNENVSNSSMVAQSIVEKIASVNASTRNMLTNSNSVQERSTALSTLAEQLRQTVDVFKLS